MGMNIAAQASASAVAGTGGICRVEYFNYYNITTSRILQYLNYRILTITILQLFQHSGGCFNYYNISGGYFNYFNYSNYKYSTITIFTLL